jgi:hypothetical protein
MGSRLRKVLSAAAFVQSFHREADGFKFHAREEPGPGLIKAFYEGCRRAR